MTLDPNKDRLSKKGTVSLTHYDHYRDFTARLIKSHEGVRTHPYHDTVGKITIGVGRNLTDRGLSVEEINLLFETDMKMAEDCLDMWLPDWRELSLKQQAGLVSMAFNLGGPRLAQFKKMRAALQARNFPLAAQEALASKWARQVGHRAKEVASFFAEDQTS